MVLHTIGHSTRAWSEFLGLLHGHGIGQVVDVRRYPASRRHPHFAKVALGDALAAAAIAYRHEPDLGGRRAPRPDSANTAWRAAGFRGYADYMETAAFRAALERLLEAGAEHSTAILCAEAVPWRCHRQLIADALVARGHEVRHILDARNAPPHVLPAFARVQDGAWVSYPGA